MGAAAAMTVSGYLFKGLTKANVALLRYESKFLVLKLQCADSLQGNSRTSRGLGAFRMKPIGLACSDRVPVSMRGESPPGLWRR